VLLEVSVQTDFRSLSG